MCSRAELLSQLYRLQYAPELRRDPPRLMVHTGLGDPSPRAVVVSRSQPRTRRLERLPRPVGRPFSPGSGWAMLALLAGDDVPYLSAPRRSQLRRHLYDADIR